MLINFCRSAVGLFSTTTPGVNDNVKKIAGVILVVFGEKLIRSLLVTPVRSNQQLQRMCEINYVDHMAWIAVDWNDPGGKPA